MKRRFLVLGVLFFGPAGLWACSLCDGRMQNSPTFRQEARLETARLILHGVVTNPRLTGGGKGASDFQIRTPLRTDAAIKGLKTVTLPRYLPVTDPKKPPHYLLFCDLDGKKVDPYRGVPIVGPKTVEYVKKALALDKKEAVKNLVFFFDYLEDIDPEVSKDAFLEFARAPDADIARAAKKLAEKKEPAEQLRKWLKNAKTPAGKVSVYAMLLGYIGKVDDAKYLRGLLDSKEDRYQQAADGILAGYMQLKAKEGWELARSILSDGRKPLTLRLSMLRTLRFQQGAQAKESKAELIKTMKAVLIQGDLADLAVEDLRRWQLWDLTPQVVTLAGKKGFDAPLMKRALIRYSLCCKATKESRDFLTKCRKADAEEVKEVEDGLKLERMK